jgi:hypothetical protein
MRGPNCSGSPRRTARTASKVYALAPPAQQGFATGVGGGRPKGMGGNAALGWRVGSRGGGRPPARPGVRRWTSKPGCAVVAAAWAGPDRGGERTSRRNGLAPEAAGRARRPRGVHRRAERSARRRPRGSRTLGPARTGAVGSVAEGELRRRWRTTAGERGSRRRGPSTDPATGALTGVLGPHPARRRAGPAHHRERPAPCWPRPDQLTPCPHARTRQVERQPASSAARIPRQRRDRARRGPSRRAILG